MTKLKRFQIASVIFTFILGTLLQFTYQWSNKNPIIAIFSSVNESTWEHLKLVFFPTLITTIIGYHLFGQKVPYFLCAKVVGVLSSMAFITVFFYTYSGILGKNIAWIDISSFYVAVILGEVIAYYFMIKQRPCHKKIAIFTFIILAVCFGIFTFYPPSIGLFTSPV